MSYAIGDVWGRSGIDPKVRELAMVAALGAASSGGYVQLRQHATYALNFGASADELREIVYQTTVTAGSPRALNMAAEIGAVLKAAGLAAKPNASGDESASSEDRHERGLQKMAELGHEPKIDIAAHPVLCPLSREFPFLVAATVDYAMGEVWPGQRSIPPRGNSPR